MKPPLDLRVPLTRINAALVYKYSMSTSSPDADDSAPDQPLNAATDAVNLEPSADPQRPAQLDEAGFPPATKQCPIVGLGGSAGSISALQAFFKSMPADTGFAFVVVVHLARDYESTLAAVLQRSSAMPVLQVTETLKVAPNTVYVIPPGKALLSHDGALALSELKQETGRRFTVDMFFRTLADTHGLESVAVVLSGMDGDGTIGIQRIKERGGLTIAQDVDEAEYPDMPRSAIATGMVDWVLRVEEIPARLVAYQHIGDKLQLPEKLAESALSADANSDTARLREIFSLLHSRTGHNFSYYKKATMLRRVARRMQINGVVDLPGYLDYLKTHTGESSMLLQDLLISVTNFFRDAHAFEALAEHIPSLFKNKAATDTVRVWVAACASGEEAYSIAMLLHEHARRLDDPPAIQVFATDLDERAIQTARLGLYPNSIASDVSADRLARFFMEERSGFRVRREMRESVLFAPHDLLTDSPFSKLDLVSCRNLLIYLTREAQQHVLDIFHFSLFPGGLLFLGGSEAVEEGDEWFSSTDRKHHIFTARAVPRSGRSPLTRSVPPPFLKGGKRRGTADANLTPASPSNRFAAASRLAEVSKGRSPSWGDLHHQLLVRLNPPSILVNPQHEIMHLSTNAGRFLQFSGGEPSRNLLHSILPTLRVELRAALYRAAHQARNVNVEPILLQLEGTARVVGIRIEPAGSIAPDFMLVLFDERSASQEEALDLEPNPPAEPLALQLERELEGVKAEMRETLEQAEASTEELEASNEELQAMNEELRSATEELETGREELAAVNEELTAVNEELKSKVDLLAHANGDLRNLMAATAIATVFLDRELCITRYTPSAVSLFNLIPSDNGRPLSDLASQLDHPELARDAARALSELIPAEREVAAEGRWFLARALPYRTTEDHIAGVVLTFVDITARKLAEEALRVSSEQLRLILENARDYAIVSMDLQRRITTWNPGAERLLGYSESEIVGRHADLVFTPEDCEAGAPQFEANQALNHGGASDERWHMRRDGSRFWGSGVMMAMHNTQGRAIGLLKIFRDQTASRLAMEELKQSRAELEAASRAKDRFLAVLSHELRTPLTPILMAMDILAARNDVPPAVHEIVNMARRNVMVQTHMIDDLLDVTRISSGRLEIVTAPMDLHEAVVSAVEVCRPLFLEKRQRLVLELAAQQHFTVGDFSRLRQAFWNIFQNASKFTPPGGRIVVSSSSDRDAFSLVVTDQGIGIPEEALPTIFDAFTQGGTRIAREFGGLGLGLAIVKATVEAHSGTVSAANAGSHAGATFRIRIPINTVGPSQ